MQVLIVDDDADALDLLDNALTRFGYRVTKASNGLEALEHVRTGRYHLIISDWEMPQMNGLDLCKEIRRRGSSSYVYFILLTSRSGTQNVVDGLNAGADEFLTKPFDPYELYVRLRVGERVLSLEARDVVIFSLAKLAEARDPETGAHLERIRAYSYVLATYLSGQDKYRGVIDGEYVQMLYLTSPLHDIGKVGIPDAILLKPGRLTTEEFEIMKQHAAIGGMTLDAAVQAYPGANYLHMARDIAMTHHERFDGTGYPRGLRGEEIPICGRIVAVSDVYDALTTRRVYKPAYSHEVARNIIHEGRGAHFDPEIVDAFDAVEEQFLDIKAQFYERAEEDEELLGDWQEPDNDGALSKA